MIDQLDAAHREQRAAQQARSTLEKLVADLHQQVDKLEKDRDHATAKLSPVAPK